MTVTSPIGYLTLRQVLGILYFLGIVLLATVILLLVGGQLRAQSREELLADGRKVAERLARDSRIALIQQAPENVRSAVEMARGFPNVEAVAIHATDGELFAGSGPPGIALARMRAEDFSGEEARLVEEDNRHLMIAAPVLVGTYSPGKDPFGTALEEAAPLDRRMLGCVFLAIDKSAADSAIRSLERKLLVWILLVAAGVFVAIVLVMTWVTQPFRRLARVMTNPQTPKRYTTAPVYGLREARDMAFSFNALIASFAGAQRELTTLNEALEARVEERTRALTEANAAKSRFLSKMSHEIRTPLHGVITSTDLLLATTEVSREQRPYVQAIHDSACLLLDVIDSVLDWAKIEAGKVKLETIDFDLHGVIQRVAMILSRQAEAKGLRLHIDIDPAAPYLLRGDPTRLSQILMNLAGNAVKFTDRGFIKIKASTVKESATEAMLRFEVVDTGIGIPVAAQARVFDYFMQADESTTRQYGGTGLGTAIAKHLVELMGGSIGVQSKTGEGSCFWFEVPFRQQEQRGLGAPRGAQRRHITSHVPRPIDRSRVRPLRILVAEDNPTNQFVIRQLLKAAGHIPRLVSDGRQALQALETEAFDLALIDMHMPGLDGHAAVASYRQQCPDSHLPIVMLTADATPTAAVAAHAAGVTAHLTKPVSVAGLLAVIDRLVVPQHGGAPPARVHETSTAPDARSVESNLPVLRLERLEQIRQKLRSPTVVAQLIETYLRDAGCGLEKVERGLTNGDWEEVREAAHVLRGASSIMGAEQVMAVCEEVERAAEDCQEDTLQRSAKRLQAAVRAVTDALKVFSGNEAREPRDSYRASKSDHLN